MPTERWQRIEQVFTEALAQPAGRRAEFLARTCGADSDLRQEVTSLLAAAQQAPDFLAAPALEVFAQQISREGWSVRAGDRIGCYTVEHRLGAGGMGEVWRARDERLDRPVAIKLLLPHPAMDVERVRLLEHEARAASRLNHANVLTVYDVGEHHGAPYLVTECLEGESLRRALRAGPLPADVALEIALQVARGVKAAHEQGIVHRDLKPENIFLTADGRAKILDFGLAERRDLGRKLGAPGTWDGSAAPAPATGTRGYMAPEQARGETVDGRADIFALGVVLREMLAGREPPGQAGASAAGPPLTPALSRLLQRCLAPDPADRLASAAELADALEAIVRRRTLPRRPGLATWLRRPLVVATACGVLGVLALGGWRWRASARLASARALAPEVQRLLNQGAYADAYLMARGALGVLPDDPLLQRLWIDASVPAAITSEPAGAEVTIAGYGRAATRALALGRTPLPDARVPRGPFRIRINKPGFEPFEGAGSPDALPRYRLDPAGSRPAGMLPVVAGRAPSRFGFAAELDDFWIDRFEVSNQQFRQFVDGGGYQRREYWREPFVDGDQTLSWDQAMARFRDRSGRAGPATWTGGTYPEGQGDFPVDGISWYEAAAYATYVGKQLPTLYHWYRAALAGDFHELVAASNFGGKGPARVGSYAGLGPFGTYDMAGNVKEWCWNGLDRRRFLLGGAWNEAGRMFETPEARGPFERATGYGVRLVQYQGALPPAVLAPIDLQHLGRDARKQAPVGDALFEVYRRQYAYDRTPLNARVEETTATAAWQRQDVSLDAAYGGERLHAYLFLPRNASPPYQPVIYFPPWESTSAPSTSDLALGWAEPVLRSGRALVYPIYKGTFERRAGSEKTGPSELRDLRIAWSRDLGRSIDYLELRPDLDRARLTFYAVGRGAAAVVLTALEPRLKFSVLQGSGLAVWGDITPETDALNFAPRVHIPVLMLNPRYDVASPVETSQRPLFDLLGTPIAEKQHTLLEVGRGIPIDAAAAEILPWLDRHLGPVVPPLSASNQ